MGAFDNNIHMNGAGTTYQAFLNLANAAEEKGGRIGERTVRLVKAGDGLATTTFSGTKGDRVSQIQRAREMFLNAIAREFGYAARSIAEKTLGDGDGQQPVPLTARSIHAVNQALGNRNALAESSALIRENMADFDIEVSFVFSELAPRMGAKKAELDRGKIQAEVLKLIGEGKFTNDKDGMRKAVREVAATRVAVAARLESLIRAKSAPAHLVRKLAETVLDDAVAVIGDRSVPDGEAVFAKLNELVMQSFKRGQIFFDCDGIAAGTEFDAKKLITDMFGADNLQTKDAQKALDLLRTTLDKAKDGKIGKGIEEFQAKCDTALALAAKTYVMRKVGIEMMLDDSENQSYGRAGVRLYDALGVGKGPNDRAITDYYFWKQDPAGMETRFSLGDKGPEGLVKETYKMVFQTIAVDYAEKLPPLPNQHPNLGSVKISIAHKVALGLADRFETAVTDEDFAKLADDFKARLAVELANVNATLGNIDIARDRAKAELGRRLDQLAGQYGIQLTQNIRNRLDGFISEATSSLKRHSYEPDKALSADECEKTILDRIEKKWLAPCRQAAAEIDASSLEPAQKKAFLAKVMENEVDAAHVKIALRTVPAFDAGGVISAARGADSGKLAEAFFRFTTSIDNQITDRDERKSVEGSDDYSAYMNTSAELLFVMHPEIGDGIRGLDADAREKLLDDAIGTSSDTSTRLQNQSLHSFIKEQKDTWALEAKHWSVATSCLMLLQQSIG